MTRKYKRDTAASDRLFAEIIQEDPENEEPYLTWSDCYKYASDGPRYDRAKEILLDLYDRTRGWHYYVLLEYLVDICKLMNEPEKAKDYIKEIEELDQMERDDRRMFFESLNEMDAEGIIWRG